MLNQLESARGHVGLRGHDQVLDRRERALSIGNLDAKAGPLVHHAVGNTADFTTR